MERVLASVRRNADEPRVIDAECERHAVGYAGVARDGEVDTVEVTEEATAKFNDDVTAALGPTVWNTGCNSWYLTDEGNVDLWPYDRKTMTAKLRRPDDRDFHLQKGGGL